MSEESFLCCDAPDCPKATKLGEADLTEWVSITLKVTIDDDGHCDTLEGDACGPDHVGPAAAAMYANWDIEESGTGEGD